MRGGSVACRDMRTRVPKVLAHVVPHGYKHVPAGLPAGLPAVRMAGRQWISLDMSMCVAKRVKRDLCVIRDYTAKEYI